MGYPSLKQPWRWLSNLTIDWRMKIWQSPIMDRLPMWANWFVRPYFYHDWRKTVINLQREMFVIGCSSIPYEPAIILNYGYDDLDYWNLCNNHKGSCSIWNCAPEPITEEQAILLIEGYKRCGNIGLALVYNGWTPEVYAAWKEKWSKWKEGEPLVDYPPGEKFTPISILIPTTPSF